MKNKFNIAFSLCVIFFFIGCKPQYNSLYTLVPSGDSLNFRLSPETSMFIKALFLYTDIEGKEYLTFQNNTESEILWYDLAFQEHVKTIKFDKEGSNGIGKFCGYYIHSENEIYIPEVMKTSLDMVNSKGEIIRKINYPKTSLGKSTLPFMSLSFPYRPIYILNNKIYMHQTPNLSLKNAIEESPVTLVLDTINNTVSEFDIRFPKVVSSEALRGNTLGVELSYSICYNGEDFVYSFFFDEDIYVVSLDGKIKRKVKVKSNYLDDVYKEKKSPANIDILAKTLCEIPMYGNLIYDKYREVYYRFAYPETNLENDNYMDIWQLGRTMFSIIILDKNFQVIGETLFPENTYASNHFFIRKDGLYISTSFVKNPNYDDDKLCFQRFDLIQK